MDVREHVNSDSYSGFTKKGIRFNTGLIDKWLSNLEKVGGPMQPGRSASLELQIPLVRLRLHGNQNSYQSVAPARSQ